MKNSLNNKQLFDLHRGFYVFGDPSCLKVLFELERYGEKNFSELRDELDINPATLSKKLKLLIEVGLISADRTHDHLRVYYSIAQHRKPLKRFLDSLERLASDL